MHILILVFFLTKFLRIIKFLWIEANEQNRFRRFFEIDLGTFLFFYYSPFNQFIDGFECQIKGKDVWLVLAGYCLVNKFFAMVDVHRFKSLIYFYSFQNFVVFRCFLHQIQVKQNALQRKSKSRVFLTTSIGNELIVALNYPWGCMHIPGTL